MKVTFACPLKDSCFRHTAKKLCGEEMQVSVTDDGRWVAEQPFCDRKPTRQNLLDGLPEYHGLFRLFRLKEKPEDHKTIKERS